MRKWIWQDLLNVPKAYYLNLEQLVLHASLSVLGIFVICVFIDQIRKNTIEKLFMKGIKYVKNFSN